MKKITKTEMVNYIIDNHYNVAVRRAGLPKWVIKRNQEREHLFNTLQYHTGKDEIERLYNGLKEA